MVQPLWKRVWRYLRKLNTELPYDPAIPLLGMYPAKTIIQKDTFTPMFIAALFTTVKEEAILRWEEGRLCDISNPTPAGGWPTDWKVTILQRLSHRSESSQAQSIWR